MQSRPSSIMPLIALILLLCAGGGTIALALTGRQAVDRHYDYLEQTYDPIGSRIADRRLHADPDEAGSNPMNRTAIILCFPIALFALLALAAAQLVGQGGLVGLLATANKFVRGLKGKRGGGSRRPASAAPGSPWVIEQTPARPGLPPGEPIYEEEGYQWVRR
jgi:hypothetical protein